eukprot:6193110-Pleurochrysis_carterae.AAC.1
MATDEHSLKGTTYLGCLLFPAPPPYGSALEQGERRVRVNGAIGNASTSPPQQAFRRAQRGASLDAGQGPHAPASCAARLRVRHQPARA